MRAIVVREFGPLDSVKVEDFPAPVPAPGEVLVDVHAAGVNFPDLLVVTGKYQILPPRPFVPGKEVAGVVSAVGSGVTTCRPGDRVLAPVEYGAFAEQAVVPADCVFPLPDCLSFVEGSAMPVVYQTAYTGLVDRARFEPGETVLVTGAAGGVGLAAVQIAKAMGATVLAAVSSPEKGALAKANGADHVIDTSVPNLRDALRQQVHAVTGGRGADVILEQVGGDVFDAALRALAWRGRIVVIGFAGGRIPEIRANYLLVKNITATGLQISDYRERMPAWLREGTLEVLRHVEAGRIRPHVMATYPLAEVGRAFEAITSRRVQGKVVLSLR